MAVGDEFRNAHGRHRRVDHHDGRIARQARDGREVAAKHEVEPLVERRIDDVRSNDDEERMAVRSGARDRFDRDIAAAARPVLDNERPAEPVGEPWRDQARDNVDTAAGRTGYNQPHRPRRIGLRPRDARCGRERGSAGGQM